MPSKLIKDMTGQRFTRLLVVDRAPSDSNGNARWNCICDCGSATVSSGFTLRNGEAKSCGCLTTEQLAERAVKHGLCGTPEYRTWASMLNRCRNPNFPGYSDYGGRGIGVCERWKVFSQFFADMGSRPSPKHSIERINNDGNYEPSNCRWATDAEQRRNTRQNHIVEYMGTKMTLMDAAKLAGLNFNCLRYRITHGWDIDRAMTEPPKELAVHRIMRERRKKAAGEH